MNEGRFPVEAWEEIFSTVPPYPLDLPDDLVRAIADLIVKSREAAERLGSGLRTGDPLQIWMYPSLLRGAVNRLDGLVSRVELAQQDQETN